VRLLQGILSGVTALALQAQTPTPLPSVTPTPQQIFAHAFQKLRSYAAPAYAVWVTTWAIYISNTQRGNTEESFHGFALHRYAERESDALENSTIPDNPRGQVTSGQLPPAAVVPIFFGPLSWTAQNSIRPPQSSNGTNMQPDVETGLKTIAVVSSSLSPSYTIENQGIESVAGHATYHLTLRPLRDVKKHNLRDLWIDTQTFDLWKAHYLGTWGYGRNPPGPSDITTYFSPVADYWAATRSIFTYVDPFDFRESTKYRFDVQTNEMTFPSTLPDWLFDRREYARHQRAREPDILGPMLNPPGSDTTKTPEP
jgi:hypothetical protein